MILRFITRGVLETEARPLESNCRLLYVEMFHERSWLGSQCSKRMHTTVLDAVGLIVMNLVSSEYRSVIKITNLITVLVLECRPKVPAVRKTRGPCASSGFNYLCSYPLLSFSAHERQSRTAA